MKAGAPRFYMVDAHMYLHRAFHALPPLTTSRGEQVGALFGFARMLLGILKQDRPDYLAVCFDFPAPTFRHKDFPQYKATRPEIDEALRFQLPKAREIVRSLGLQAVELEGYEADDLLATLVERAARLGWESVIVSSDKDALQLVGPKVKVLNSFKGTLLDAGLVEQKYGVPPEKLADYFALAGDSVDNVPGARGIGGKTAAKLLREHGSLDRLLELADEDPCHLPRGIYESLAEFRSRAGLGKRLVLLERNAPLKIQPGECVVGRPSEEEFISVFSRLEFHSLIRQVFPQGSKIPTGSGKKEVSLDEFLRKARSSASGAPGAASSASGRSLRKISLAFQEGAGEGELDLKGPGLDGPVFGLGLEDGTVCAAPVKDFSPRELKALKSILGDGDCLKIAHDWKSLINGLRRHGITVSGPFYDTALASYVINPSRSRYTFEDSVLEHLSVPLALSPGAEGLKTIVREIWPLADKLKKGMIDSNLSALLEEVEIPLMEILSDMESAGVEVDTSYLRRLSSEFESRIGELKREIDRLAGVGVNLNSPKQLSFLLFQKLELPVVRKTKTGYSTDEEVLKTLAPRSPVPARILDYRECVKLKSTYIDNLLSEADPRTKRVHTRFNQMGTATGRLSSSRPNLQNIPIRTALGQKIRRAFIAGKGNLFVSADYSQIDLRVLAHVTGDEALCAAFEKGEDIHLKTACEVFHLKPHQVDSEARRRAKAINFGIVYGQTPHGLSHELGITHQQAQDYIKGYFERYPGVSRWIRETIEEAKKTSFVRTPFGRIRYLPEINSPNGAVRGFAQRAAVNTPIQGGSADIIKKAMIVIARGIRKEGFKSIMVIQVHDDLLFEVPEKEASRFGKWVKNRMEGAVGLRVPVKVDVKSGKNWTDIQKV